MRMTTPSPQSLRPSRRPDGPRRHVGMAALVSLTLILGGCSSGADEVTDEGSATTDGTSAPAEDGRSLVVAHPQEPPDWNHVQGTATAIRVLTFHNIVEPLVERMGDGSFEPLLAESYEVTDDGLTYTFHIREATFHDGSDLDAADVVYSLEYNRESPNGQVSVPFEAVESIEATDEATVVVTLSQPSQRFLVGMSRDSGMVIPEDSGDAMAQGPIGTGPYVFGDWRPGVDVTLDRYEDYWGDLPFFDDVTWRFISDETASINALLAGDVDMIASILGEGIDRYASVDETDGFRGVTTAGSEITYLSLNATDPAFEDERIRQAIAHAIDRQPILDGAFAGLASPNCVFVNPPSEPWNSDHCPYPYDPSRSRALLAEAGAEGMQIDFKHLTIAEFPPIMEVVTAQLSEVGFNVVTEGRELATYLDEVLGEANDYQFTSLSGPSQIDAWVCPGRFTLDCLPEFDDLLLQADAAVDVDEWASLRRQAVEMHADRAFLIPIGNKEEVTLIRDDLAGVKSYRSASEMDLRHLSWSS